MTFRRILWIREKIMGFLDLTNSYDLFTELIDVMISMSLFMIFAEQNLKFDH